MDYITTTFLAETAELLRNDKINLLDYLNALCDRIETLDPQIEALLPEKDRRQRLIREATELQQRFPQPEQRPPLYGVPVGVKDIFRVDGFPTQAGSQLPAAEFAGPEAACVTRLKQAGALILGKTVTTEFAYFEPGPTRNPHNLQHTPGGSSSGSAAGVACGFFPLAIGTQTIGSVIRPAAFCGIIGFKPSYGRIPTDGLIIFSQSADHVGLFAQDLVGVNLAASILCHDWKPTPTPSQEAGVLSSRGSVVVLTPLQPSPKGRESPLSFGEGPGVRSLELNSPASQEGKLPVFGVPDGKYLAQASAEGLAAFEASVRQLAQAGYTIKRLRVFDEIDALNQRHRLLTAAEAAQEHAVWFAKYRALYRPKTAEVILQGQQVTEAEVRRARAGQLVLRHELETLQRQAGIDLWLSPAATGDAPAGLHATGDPVMNLPWTHAGLPALTLPAGTSPRGLPFGLQLTAAFGEDEKLIAWAECMLLSFH